MSAIVFVQPLDLVKNRMQLSGKYSLGVKERAGPATAHRLRVNSFLHMGCG